MISLLSRFLSHNMNKVSLDLNSHPCMLSFSWDSNWSLNAVMVKRESMLNIKVHEAEVAVGITTVELVLNIG